MSCHTVSQEVSALSGKRNGFTGYVFNFSNSPAIGFKKKIAYSGVHSTKASSGMELQSAEFLFM